MDNNAYRRNRYKNDPVYRQKILDAASKKYKEWRKLNPIKPRVLLSKEEKAKRTKARRKRLYWFGGIGFSNSKEGLSAMRKTAIFKAKNNEKLRLRYKNDPEFRKRSNQINRKWFNKKIKTCVYYRTSIRLRDRLKKATNRALIMKSAPRGQDKEGAAFLVWLANRMSISITSDYHIDHIIPVSRWTEFNVDYKINSPENIRWLTKEENARKSNYTPTQQEINNHINTVNIWREQLKQYQTHPTSILS